MSYLVDAGYTVFGFVFDITVVVFFHELGHFAVGRLCGVRIDAFSIGFGPELLAWTDRRGTRWRVAALPLGGYVKFHGDMNVASVGPSAETDRMSAAERAETFQAQPVAKRAAIVAAGPVANFVLAMAIMTALIYWQGVPSSDARIGAVKPGTPAAAAGFRPGDLVTAVDGAPVSDFAAMRDIVSASADKALRFTVRRGGGDLTIDAVPRVEQGKGGAMLGVEVARQAATLPRAVADAGDFCWNVVSTTGRYVGNVIRLREKPDQVSGPIGIATVAGQAARMGIGSVFFLISLISVSIGLMNLLPVPLLDGGHLLYYACEAVRGRPLSPRVQEMGFRVGLAFVVVLMVFATKNDLVSAGARLFHAG